MKSPPDEPVAAPQVEPESVLCLLRDFPYPAGHPRDARRRFVDTQLSNPVGALARTPDPCFDKAGFDETFDDVAVTRDARKV